MFLKQLSECWSLRKTVLIDVTQPSFYTTEYIDFALDVLGKLFCIFLCSCATSLRCLYYVRFVLFALYYYYYYYYYYYHHHHHHCHCSLKLIISMELMFSPLLSPSIP
jgi:hypothetical protein